MPDPTAGPIQEGALILRLAPRTLTLNGREYRYYPSALANVAIDDLDPALAEAARRLDEPAMTRILLDQLRTVIPDLRTEDLAGYTVAGLRVLVQRFVIEGHGADPATADRISKKVLAAAMAVVTAETETKPTARELTRKRKTKRRKQIQTKSGKGKRTRSSR